ncbi:hypothetical protein pb186bvf_008241 [Paramecium bursaria]
MDQGCICGKNENLSRCSGCKSIYYCSPECQKQDWKSHKIRCNEIQIQLKLDQERAERKAKGIRSIDDFTDLQFIGTGNFSEILKVKEIETNKVFALKRIDKRKLQQVNKEKDVYMEKHCLQKLKDMPCVIEINATFQDEFNLYMLMEYVENGELWQQIHGYGAGSSQTIKYFTYHILQAITQIHQLGIAHRDIKSENILLTKDFQIKFIDFGSARDMFDDTIEGSGNGRKGKKSFKHFVGTPQFMAPECIRNKDSSFKSDIYSLGVLFYQILYGVFPFDGNSDYLVFQAALETELKFPTDWINDPLLVDLIKKMMERDPELRIDLASITQHEYFTTIQPPQTYEEAIQNHNELDSFSYDLIKQLRQAEKLEDKINIEFQFKKILKNVVPANEEQEQRLKYIENQAYRVLRKWEDQE